MTFYKVACLCVFIWTLNEMVTVGERANLKDSQCCDFRRHLYVLGPRFSHLWDISTQKRLKWMELVKSCKGVLNQL